LLNNPTPVLPQTSARVLEARLSRLLAVGGLAWDRVLTLSAPATPGARVTATRLAHGPDGDRFPGRLGGGAANAAVAWTRAGHHAWAAGVVSTDGDGDLVMHALASAGVHVEAVSRTSAASGTTLILVAPDGERTIIGIASRERERVLSDYRGLAASLSDLIDDQRVDGVFLRAPAPLARPLVPPIKVLAHWDGREAPASADIVVVSSDDLGGANLDEAHHRLSRFPDPRRKWLVLTLGARGAEALSAGQRLSAPALAVPVVDTTGAGDIFAAGLLSALTDGAGMDEALQLGCEWGARAVGQLGSAPVDAPAGHFPRARQGKVPFLT
jgi:sugar/nucleoside kinase (ribokinase family)